MKNKYRSIWISDVHLGTKDSRYELLMSFLKENNSEYLYLVGDIFDIWQLKRGWYWPQEYNNVIRKILSMAKKGTKVVFIPGNHDDIFREYIGYKFGEVEILRDCTHTMLDGRKIWVLHGDEFDLAMQINGLPAKIGSIAYDYLITINRLVNWMREKVGLPYYSLSGSIKGKIKNAVKYMSRYESVVSEEAKNRNMDGVICGHIHQPNIIISGSFTYANSGDWIENCTALVETLDGQLMIVKKIS